MGKQMGLFSINSPLLVSSGPPVKLTSNMNALETALFVLLAVVFFATLGGLVVWVFGLRLPTWRR
jgi:hypothetical protein